MRGAQRSHGKPHVGAPRIDEMPRGVPASARHERPGDRTHTGQFTTGNTLASKGGSAKAKVGKLAGKPFTREDSGKIAARHKHAAERFRRDECKDIAAKVGGGECGPGPSSVVASAALALALSRHFADRADETGDPADADRAVKYANESRNHLLAARAMAADEAMARAPATWTPPVLPPVLTSNRVDEAVLDVEPDPFPEPDSCHDDARGQADVPAVHPTPHPAPERPSEGILVTPVPSTSPEPAPVRQTELRTALTLTDVLPLPLLPWARDIARIVDLSNTSPDGWARAFRDGCTWLNRRGRGPSGELIAQLDRLGPDGRIGWAPRRTA